MTGSIACVMFTLGQNANKISLVKFESDRHNRQVMANTHGSPQNIESLKQQLNNVTTAAAYQNIIGPLCDFVERALDFIPPPCNWKKTFREKLAVMIVDGTICCGTDPEILANEFETRGIILVVVPLGTYVLEIWDFYRELARKLGGRYMLMQDVPYILPRFISLTVIKGYIVDEAFRLANQVNHNDNMNEQNEITDGVGDMDFDLVFS